MLCAKPFRRGVEAFGCGQCMPCRINRKRLWVSRIMLEAMCHGDSLFVTLTYDNDHLPENLSVSKKEVQDWLKRLRFAIEPRRIKYYAVGEYGTLSGRPHYHAIIFGLNEYDRRTIEHSWDKGSIHIGTVTVESAGYCVSYISEARTKQSEIDRSPKLLGRTPEFALMSKGLGKTAVGVLAASTQRVFEHRYAETRQDAPREYRIAAKKYPLGRYLTGKLREALGYSEAGEPRELRDLRLRELIEKSYVETTKVFIAKDLKQREAAKQKAIQKAKLNYLKGGKL